MVKVQLCVWICLSRWSERIFVKTHFTWFTWYNISLSSTLLHYHLPVRSSLLRLALSTERMYWKKKQYDIYGKWWSNGNGLWYASVKKVPNNYLRVQVSLFVFFSYSKLYSVHWKTLFDTQTNTYYLNQKAKLLSSVTRQFKKHLIPLSI